MEGIRTAEQREGLVRPLATLAAEPATPPGSRAWVHEWHEPDETLTACGLPTADERLASDDSQVDCPGCLAVLADERRAGNAHGRGRRGRAGGKHGRDGADRGNVGLK